MNIIKDWSGKNGKLAGMYRQMLAELAVEESTIDSLDNTALRQLADKCAELSDGVYDSMGRVSVSSPNYKELCQKYELLQSFKCRCNTIIDGRRVRHFTSSEDAPYIIPVYTVAGNVGRGYLR